MMSADKKSQYEMRFRLFIRQIISVNRIKPKERYLYRIMDGVPFKDLETAILMAKIDNGEAIDESANDNRG